MKPEYTGGNVTMGGNSVESISTHAFTNATGLSRCRCDFRTPALVVAAGKGAMYNRESGDLRTAPTVTKSGCGINMNEQSQTMLKRENRFSRIGGNMKKIIMLVICLMAMPLVAQAATYYVCDTGSSCISGSTNSDWVTGNDTNNCTTRGTSCKTIVGGIAKMASGDTLVIGNGTYRGSNQLNYYAPYPHNGTGFTTIIPSGTSSAYTTIMAENDGGAYINGADVTPGGYRVFAIEGASSQQNSDYTNADYNTVAGGTIQRYILVRGLLVSGGIYISAADHIKLINVGEFDAADGNSWGIEGISSQYLLFEGCYAYGGGRAKFGLYHSHYCVVRNCVARHDWVNDANDPMSTFDNYSGTNNEWQNDIAIDSDQTSKYTTDEDNGTFCTASTSAVAPFSGPVNWTNDIALNVTNKFTETDNVAYQPTVNMTNVVGWNIKMSIPGFGSQPFYLAEGTTNIAYGTFGSVSKGSYGDSGNGNAEYFACWYAGNSSTISNSIFDGFNAGDPMFSPGAGGSLTVTYPNIYSYTGTINAGGTTISSTISTNPQTTGLLYLPRIETSGSLYTAGASGTHVGANIVYQYGASGTLYGDPGYNLLQDGTNGQAAVPLWPFPNETLIKAQMATYSNHGVTGARGFCTGTSKDGSAQTLTKYIWEYLGNQIPSSVYANQALPAPSGLHIMQ